MIKDAMEINRQGKQAEFEKIREQQRQAKQAEIEESLKELERIAEIIEKAPNKNLIELDTNTLTRETILALQKKNYIVYNYESYYEPWNEPLGGTNIFLDTTANKRVKITGGVVKYKVAISDLVKDIPLSNKEKQKFYDGAAILRH